jgi:hypothetical protein
LNPTSEQTKDEILKQKAQARDTKRRSENVEKAKALADELFPNEKWKLIEPGIYLSPQRPTRGQTYKDELRNAQILRDSGSTIYMVPEIRSDFSKKYDAIVDGMMMEFKNVGGNANTLIAQFLRSRAQAPNVFINLETAHLLKREVMGALYKARNSITHTDPKGNVIKGYADSTKFAGGLIILKLIDIEHLIYLNVDDLQAK